MGEYWKPVNLTRREYIHPHRVDEGLKLREWDRPTSRVWRLINERWSVTDDVRAVSDYGGRANLFGDGDEDWPDYESLDENYIEIGGESSYASNDDE